MSSGPSPLKCFYFSSVKVQNSSDKNYTVYTFYTRQKKISVLFEEFKDIRNKYSINEFELKSEIRKFFKFI